VAVRLQNWHLAHGKNALLPISVEFWHAVAAFRLCGERIAKVCEQEGLLDARRTFFCVCVCVRARVGVCIAFKAFAANDEEDAGHLIENGHVTAVLSFCKCHIPTTCKSTSARPVRLKYSSLMGAAAAATGAGAATTRGAL
jgi:hypothetical protein